MAKIHSQQKHILRLVYKKDRYYYTKELFISCNVLNVYKLNLLNTSIFMHKIKSGSGPAAYHTTFKMTYHSYPTHFSSVNYSKPKTMLSKRRFWISIRGPAIWNNFVVNKKKELESSSLFKSKVEAKLLDFENGLTFFWNKYKVYFCFVFLLLWVKLETWPLNWLPALTIIDFGTWWQSHLDFLQVPP